MENVLFGFEGKHNNPLNVIFIIAKQVIYKQCGKNSLPTLKHIQREILGYYDATKFIAFTNCTHADYFSFW